MIQQTYAANPKIVLLGNEAGKVTQRILGELLNGYAWLLCNFTESRYAGPITEELLTTVHSLSLLPTIVESR